jgi:hypothetical protein
MSQARLRRTLPTPATGALLAGIALLSALLGACQPKESRPTAPWPASGAVDHTTPAQAYAGEVLSYMIQVVLGAAGPVDNRELWQHRGLDVPLDYHEIDAILNSTEGDKTRLMVLDPNILGLSNVLYHYDRRLNRFKGHTLSDSLYPSTELLALRQLLVRKQKTGGKIGLSALWHHQDLLRSTDRSADPADLQKFNLSVEELKLLQAVIEAEPHFLEYLHDPNIVGALTDMQLVQEDTAIQRSQQLGGTPELAFEHISGPRDKRAVRVAILPSLTAAFSFGPHGGQLSRHGFRATKRYVEAVNRVAAELSAAYAAGATPTRPGVDIFALMERPLVVTPENDRAVVERICPWAKVVIILLGKDVYLSLGPKSAGLPPRIYLDIDAVRDGIVADEIEMAAAFLRLPN